MDVLLQFASRRANCAASLDDLCPNYHHHHHHRDEEEDVDEQHDCSRCVGKYCLEELYVNFPKLDRGGRNSLPTLQVVDDVNRWCAAHASVIKYWAARFQATPTTNETHTLQFENTGTGEQGTYLNIAAYVPAVVDGVADAPMHMFHMSTNHGPSPSIMTGCVEQSTGRFFFCDLGRGFVVTNDLVVADPRVRLPMLPPFGSSVESFATYLSSAAVFLAGGGCGKTV